MAQSKSVTCSTELGVAMDSFMCKGYVNNVDLSQLPIAFQVELRKEESRWQEWGSNSRIRFCRPR